MQNPLLVLVALLLGAVAVAFTLADSGDRVPAAWNEPPPRGADLDSPSPAFERTSDSSVRAPVSASDPEPRGGGEGVVLPPEARAEPEELADVDFAEQARERAVRELEHERATAKGRAEQAAKQLNLTESQSIELAELYLAFGHRRRDTLAALRAQHADHETMRQALQDLGSWQSDELGWQFGRELAGKIQDLDALVSPARDPRTAGK